MEEGQGESGEEIRFKTKLDLWLENLWDNHQFQFWLLTFAIGMFLILPPLLLIERWGLAR